MGAVRVRSKGPSEAGVWVGCKATTGVVRAHRRQTSQRNGRTGATLNSGGPPVAVPAPAIMLQQLVSTISTQPADQVGVSDRVDGAFAMRGTGACDMAKAPCRHDLMDIVGTRTSIFGGGATISAPRDGQDVKLRVLLGAPPPRLPYLSSFSLFLTCSCDRLRRTSETRVACGWSLT